MKSLDLRFAGWIVLGSFLALGFVACGGSEDDSEEVVASSNGTSSGGSGGPMCRECTASQTRLVDSSVRCGYRCVSSASNTTGGGTDSPPEEEEECVVECSEGFEIVFSPQRECGFFCQPIAEGDGSQFEDVGGDVASDVGMSDSEDPMDVANDTSADVASDVAADVPEDTGMERRQLTIGRPLFHPEGIARGADGTLYVGSFTSGEIVRFAPGTTEAQDFLAAGVVQASALGMIVDDAAGKLWVCGADFNGVVPSELYAIDIATRALDAQYALPEGSFCNDLAVDAEGNIYMTDSFRGRIVRLLAGGEATEVWAEDEGWAPSPEGFPLSVNGITFDSASNTLYFGLVDTGAVYSVAINEDGSAGAVNEIVAADGMAIDGMKLRASGELIMVKGGGLYSLADFDGLWTLSEIAALDEPTTFAFNADASAAWVVQSQFNALFDGDEETNALLPFLVVEVLLP